MLGYVLTAVICLSFGGMIGFLAFAIVSANKDVAQHAAEKERLLAEAEAEEAAEEVAEGAEGVEAAMA